MEEAADCFGGLFGGNHSLGKMPGHNCSSSGEWNAWWDWRPVSCLADDNTPYLGTFYRFVFAEFGALHTCQRGGVSASRLALLPPTREETEPVLDSEARYDVRLRAAKRSESGLAKNRHSYDGGGGEQRAGWQLFNYTK